MKQDDIIQKAVEVLRQHAAGIKVSEADLDWAVWIALNNPQRFPERRKG